MKISILELRKIAKKNNISIVDENGNKIKKNKLLQKLKDSNIELKYDDTIKIKC